MAIDRRKTFQKQPFESYPLDISFKHSVPLTASYITEAEASAIGYHRKDPTDTFDASTDVLISTTPVVLGPTNLKIRIVVKDGVDDHDYKITLRVTFDDGSKLEQDIYMRVQEE